MNAPKEPAAMDFDAWAVLSARLLKRSKEERREILRAAEIDAAAWERWDVHFNTLLSEDLSEDRAERPLRYGEICAAEMRRRKEEAAAPPPSPAPVEPGVVPVPQPPAGTAPPVAAPPVALPSAWLGREVPVVAEAARAIGGESTLDLPVSPLLAELPFPDVDGELRGPNVSWEQVTARAPLPPPSSPDALDRTLEPVDPAAPGFSTPEPVLTLSQYASLFVDLRRTPPSRRLELLHRYRLAGEPSYEALSGAYKERFARDPTQRDRWVALCSEYQAWLDAKGRGA